MVEISLQYVGKQNYGIDMKIVDTILFYNEYDILELRLKIMADHVDKIVIVESDKTFTGKYKGFNLEKHWNRYSQWHDKINYIKISNNNHSNDAWANEHWQRDQMIQGWKDLEKDDVILLSDCDEIVRPEALDFIRKTDYEWYGLYMPAFYFKFNYMDTKPDWHYKVWGRAFRNISFAPHKMRYTNDHDLPGRRSVSLHHAGWHFGWLGDEDFARTKLQSFSHTEWNRPDILDNINIDKHISEGRDHVRPENITWVKVDLDNYFPSEITNNKEKYKNFILPDTGKTVQDYWPKNILEIN